MNGAGTKIEHALVSVCVIALAGCIDVHGRQSQQQTTKQALSSENDTTLSVIPLEVDLGTIQCGGKVSGSVTLTNSGSHVVQIMRSNRSCECVIIDPECFVMEPKEVRKINIKVDLAESPEFEGGLGPEVRLIGEHGQVVACIKIVFAARATALEYYK